MANNSSNPTTPPEPTRYTRPEGVMGGPCLHCQASQPEHRGLTCDEVREHRSKAMRRTFAQAHANATLETIKQYLETMIHSAEVYVDAEDVITAYKIKTGALHKLIGHLGLSIPVNHPVVGAPETTGDPLLRESAERFHSTYCPTCPDNPCSLGIALRTAPDVSDELTVKFPRAWAPYLQAVILGALGDMDGDGDCRWHLNELQKFLGRATEKSEGNAS